jgi:hypothetical protein
MFHQAFALVNLCNQFQVIWMISQVFQRIAVIVFCLGGFMDKEKVFLSENFYSDSSLIQFLKVFVIIQLYDLFLYFFAFFHRG